MTELSHPFFSELKYPNCIEIAWLVDDAAANVYVKRVFNATCPCSAQTISVLSYIATDTVGLTHVVADTISR
jgi:hypothetical protein